jgi:hypothetical protein
MNSAGSPVWQGGLLLAGILFLLFELWRGWRAGFARAGINFAAIILSSVVALFAGHLAAAPFGGVKEPGGFFSALVVGGGLGVFVFFLLWLTGIIFFKRTDHQSSGLFRLLWGGGGALFGLGMGVMILWGGISIIRLLGVLAEARLEVPAPASAAPARPGTTPIPAAPAEKPSALAQNLVKLKDSLELGPAGKVVQAVDVMPPDFYELILQVGRLTSNQDAMVRFLQYPGVQDVIQSPKMAALLGDPDVVKAAEEKNFLALMGSKTLREAVEDPALAEQLKKIDLRAALKHALDPAAIPAPSPAGAGRAKAE